MRKVMMVLGTLLLAGAVHAGAEPTCVLSAQNLALPPYVWTSPAVTTRLPLARVSCSADVPQNVSVSAALSLGVGTVRALQGPQGVLAYTVAVRGTEVSPEQPWGDGTAGTVVFTRTLNTLSTPEVDVIPVWTILPGQQVASGDYTDTLTLTLTIVAP